MKLRVAWISPKARSKEPAFDELTEEYVQRIRKYQPIETVVYPGEPEMLKAIERNAGRVPPMLVLLDSRGREMTSENFAEFILEQQGSDVQQLIFAIGPPDGFSGLTRAKATAMISFGPMTLSHELARVVLLEQIYRAFTIIRKHPYHCGH